MYRYVSSLKGLNVYSECVGIHKPCDHLNCKAEATFELITHSADFDHSYFCEKHLEIKDYIYQGQCDGCYKSSLEKWLCLVKLNTPNLLKLCKKCYRIKRRSKP